MSGMLCKLSYANNFKDVSVDAWFHLYFGAFNRRFRPKQLTNSYTDAHQEQFGVHYLSQGQFDEQLGGAEI